MYTYMHRGYSKVDPNMIPVSVKKTFLRRGRDLGDLARETPNRGLDSVLCCCVARQRLAHRSGVHKGGV